MASFLSRSPFPLRAGVARLPGAGPWPPQLPSYRARPEGCVGEAQRTTSRPCRSPGHRPPPPVLRPSLEPPGSAVVAETAAVLGAGAPARLPSCVPRTPRSPAGRPGAGAAPPWAHPPTRRTPPHREAPPEREQSREGTSQAARGRSSAPLGAARAGAPPQRNTLGPGVASHLEPSRVSGPAAARCFSVLLSVPFCFFQLFLVA